MEAYKLIPHAPVTHTNKQRTRFQSHREKEWTNISFEVLKNSIYVHHCGLERNEAPLI